MTNEKYISDHFTPEDARRFDDETRRHEVRVHKDFHYNKHIKYDLPVSGNPEVRRISNHPDFNDFSSPEAILNRMRKREETYRFLQVTHNPDDCK